MFKNTNWEINKRPSEDLTGVIQPSEMVAGVKEYVENGLLKTLLD